MAQAEREGTARNCLPYEVRQILSLQTFLFVSHFLKSTFFLLFLFSRDSRSGISPSEQSRTLAESVVVVDETSPLISNVD